MMPSRETGYHPLLISKMKQKNSSIWKNIVSILNTNPTSLKKDGIYSLFSIVTKTKDNIKC